MPQHLRETFAGKRVLVTGHTGFKGPWLLVILEMLGATTLGYSLEPETKPSMFELIGATRLCRHETGDLRDRQTLNRIVDDFEPEFVLHMGAQSLVRRSYRDPLETFDSNFTGTLNVLDALRRWGGACVGVMVTTDKVYAESGSLRAYVEDDKLGGHDPYSASKAACEIVVDSYRKSFFHPSKHAEHRKVIATARAGNVIGGGDWCEDRLVPDVVRAMSRGERVRVRNPRAVRPWQHVLEPLSGYLTLAAHLSKHPVSTEASFNFGPDESDVLEVERVVQLALQAWGSGSYYTDIDPNAPHEAALLRINSDRAKAKLNWRPRWNATTAIEKTVEWYRHATRDPLAYTRKQILEYFAAS